MPEGGGEANRAGYHRKLIMGDEPIDEPVLEGPWTEEAGESRAEAPGIPKAAASSSQYVMFDSAGPAGPGNLKVHDGELANCDGREFGNAPPYEIAFGPSQRNLPPAPPYPAPSPPHYADCECGCRCECGNVLEWKDTVVDGSVVNCDSYGSTVIAVCGTCDKYSPSTMDSDDGALDAQTEGRIVVVVIVHLAMLDVMRYLKLRLPQTALQPLELNRTSGVNPSNLEADP